MKLIDLRWALSQTRVWSERSASFGVLLAEIKAN
jgi:hypothetical protein